VTVAAALAAYAVCAGLLGPRLLGRADWAERAPRLGILTYLAAGWSVAAAFGLAGLTLTVHATALGGGTCCAPRPPGSRWSRCCSRWPRPRWRSRWAGSSRPDASTGVKQAPV
jgi:hypothetical protein